MQSPREFCGGRFTSRSRGSRSDDNEPLLLEERTDSDYMKLDDGDDELQFMDIDEQIRNFEKLNETETPGRDFENSYDMDGSADPNMRPRASAPHPDQTKFRIQGLEEVSEKTDEDDVSYISAGSCGSSSSSKMSNETEINERIAISE